ncbi:hypothetical protein AB0N07_06995 [Streptomyces sp. NPDC051172]
MDETLAAHMRPRYLRQGPVTASAVPGGQQLTYIVRLRDALRAEVLR